MCYLGACGALYIGMFSTYGVIASIQLGNMMLKQAEMNQGDEGYFSSNWMLSSLESFYDKACS
jgi:hypothetical protein